MRSAPYPTTSGSRTTPTPSGTRTRSASRDRRRPRTTPASTVVRPTSRSSTTGGPRHTTPSTGHDCSARSAPTTSSPRRSTTTASRCGMLRARATSRPSPAAHAVTSSARSPRPCAAEGLRFGVYYSGGLDWAFTDLPALTSSRRRGCGPPDRRRLQRLRARPRRRPHRALPARPHLERHRLARCGKGARRRTRSRRCSRHTGRVVPDGIVNDRWGADVWDYRTSEYDHDTDARIRARVGALPRPRVLLRLQPGRGRVAHALAA